MTPTNVYEFLQNQEEKINKLTERNKYLNSIRVYAPEKQKNGNVV